DLGACRPPGPRPRLGASPATWGLTRDVEPRPRRGAAPAALLAAGASPASRGPAGSPGTRPPLPRLWHTGRQPFHAPVRIRGPARIHPHPVAWSGCRLPPGNGLRKTSAPHVKHVCRRVEHRSVACRNGADLSSPFVRVERWTI